MGRLKKRVPNLVDLSIGSPKERKAIVGIKKSLKESSRKMAAGDKKEIAKVKQCLIDAGIITPTGRLTKHYR